MSCTSTRQRNSLSAASFAKEGHHLPVLQRMDTLLIAVRPPVWWCRTVAVRPPWPPAGPRPRAAGTGPSAQRPRCPQPVHKKAPEAPVIHDYRNASGAATGHICCQLSPPLHTPSRSIHPAQQFPSLLALLPTCTPAPPRARNTTTDPAHPPSTFHPDFACLSTA